jgi:hypothetical protein
MQLVSDVYRYSTFRKIEDEDSGYQKRGNHKGALVVLA